MAVFTDILPPPQSLENLDNWGDLDSLSWSLDSAIWDTVGIYGLVASDTADSTSSLSYHLTRCLFLSGNAQSAGVMSGVVVAEIDGDGYSKTDGILSVGRVQHVSCIAGARASASDIFLRISPLMVSEPAVSGGTSIVNRVRTSGAHNAFSSAIVQSSFIRTRSVNATSSSASKEFFAFLRVRDISFSAFANTLEEMEGSRFYGLVAVERAKTGESIQYFRIVQRHVLSEAFSDGSFIGGRLLGVTCKSDAQTVEHIFLSRVIDFLGEDESYSCSKVSPVYKGWNWEGQEISEKTEWEQLFSDKAIWSKENISVSSVWAEQERKQQNWKQQTAGKNCWNGVVEWQ